MALEPIGVSPFVSLITGDAKLLITATAGYQHLVGGHLAIVNRVNYLVSIHIHLFISLTHLLYRITLKAKSQHLFWIISTISSQLIGLMLGVIAHRVGVTVQGEGVPLGLALALGIHKAFDLFQCHLVFLE